MIKELRERETKDILINGQKFQLWMHVMLKLIRDTNMAVVACRTPNWECLVIELPTCQSLKSIVLDIVPEKECHQIRSGMIYPLRPLGWQTAPPIDALLQNSKSTPRT